MLPIFQGHPVIDNPVTVRAAAALPAAGAWDAAPAVIACAGFRYAMFYLAYTLGGAGGAFDLQLQVSPRAVDDPALEDWFTQSLMAAGALAAGADTQSRVQREYVTYQATAGGVENVAYGPVDLGGAVERLRLPCRESGNVGAPGNLHVVAVLMP